jgi:hypothetical protein
MSFKERWIFFSCTCLLQVGLIVPSLFGQQSTDSLSVRLINYWKKDAYSQFKTDTNFIDDKSVLTSYETTKDKYNSANFDYNEKSINNTSFFGRIKKWLNDFFESLLPDWNVDMSNVMMYILIALGCVALAFVFYKIFFSKNRLFQRERKEATEDDIQFVEKNLQSVDIQPYIQQAIDDKEWNKAIRYLHLLNLQILAQKEIIQWDYRKTNREFITEISNPTWKAEFEKTTELFNYIWFGDFTLSKEEFERYQADFIHFKNQIR